MVGCSECFQDGAVKRNRRPLFAKVEVDQGISGKQVPGILVVERLPSRWRMRNPEIIFRTMRETRRWRWGRESKMVKSGRTVRNNGGVPALAYRIT